MKTRDVLKYAVAATIALFTFGSIVALEVAKRGRKIQDPGEQRQIQQTLDTFGQVDRPPTAPAPSPRPGN